MTNEEKIAQKFAGLRRQVEYACEATLAEAMPQLMEHHLEVHDDLATVYGDAHHVEEGGTVGFGYAAHGEVIDAGSNEGTMDGRDYDARTDAGSLAAEVAAKASGRGFVGCLYAVMKKYHRLDYELDFFGQTMDPAYSLIPKIFRRTALSVKK